MTIGIYFLLIKDKLYIGKSISIERRLQEHSKAILEGKHTNIKMQGYFNIYRTIEYGIVEECTPNTLDIKEVYWIKELNTIEDGFNITSGGDGGGIGYYNNNAKYSRKKIIEVFMMLLDPTIRSTDISRATGVGGSIIREIMALNDHTWLEHEFPSEYQILRDIKNNKLRGNKGCKTSKELGIVYPALVSPNGDIFSSIDNIAEFSRVHRLDPSALRKVLIGDKAHHKNWRIKVDSI